MQKNACPRELAYHVAPVHSILVLHQLIQAEDLAEDIIGTILYAKLVRQQMIEGASTNIFPRQ